MKKCRKCEIEKPLSEFTKNTSAKDGRQSSCRECAAKYHRENKEERKAYKTAYCKAHVEDIKQYSAKYYKEHRDKRVNQQAEYRKENSEKLKAYRKRYYENNKDKFKKRHADYYENNTEKIKKRSAAKRNRDKEIEDEKTVGHETKPKPMALIEKIWRTYEKT